MARLNEHATIAKRQKSRKMREASYECTLVSKYLGVPFHVNNIKEMDEARPVYRKNTRQ